LTSASTKQHAKQQPQVMKRIVKGYVDALIIT